MSQSANGHVKKHEGPYWRRAHRDWRFYVGAFLMIAALVVYELNFNLLAWSISKQTQQSNHAKGIQE